MRKRKHGARSCHSARRNEHTREHNDIRWVTEHKRRARTGVGRAAKVDERPGVQRGHAQDIARLKVAVHPARLMHLGQLARHDAQRLHGQRRRYVQTTDDAAIQGYKHVIMDVAICSSGQLLLLLRCLPVRADAVQAGALQCFLCKQRAARRGNKVL